MHLPQIENETYKQLAVLRRQIDDIRSLEADLDEHDVYWIFGVFREMIQTLTALKNILKTSCVEPKYHDCIKNGGCEVVNNKCKNCNTEMYNEIISDEYAIKYELHYFGIVDYIRLAMKTLRQFNKKYFSDMNFKFARRIDTIMVRFIDNYDMYYHSIGYCVEQFYSEFSDYIEDFRNELNKRDALLEEVPENENAPFVFQRDESDYESD